MQVLIVEPWIVSTHGQMHKPFQLPNESRVDAAEDTIGVLSNAGTLSRAAYVAPTIVPKAATTSTDIVETHLPEDGETCIILHLSPPARGRS